MFKLFKRKKEEEKEEQEKKAEEKKASGEKEEKINLSSVLADIDRIKASIEALNEVRKSFTERFGRISEQIGELRSMILDRDRTIKEIELKAIKAHDLVESVQPDKIMAEYQKQNIKIEALKSNIEGNESIMDRIMEELKETKRKISFFGSVEEIIKLSEEIKKDLIEIKKIESKTSINADKVETLYMELKNKFQRIEEISSEFQELKVGIEQNTKDIGFLKDKITGLAEKNELEKLVNKVQRYIDALKELQKKSALTKDIEKIRTILESLK